MYLNGTHRVFVLRILFIREEDGAAWPPKARSLMKKDLKVCICAQIYLSILTCHGNFDVQLLRYTCFSGTSLYLIPTICN